MKQKMLFLIVGMVGMLFIVTSAAAASFALSVGSASSTPGAEASVPIRVRGASNVGALQFEITYDGALLTPLKVEAGSLAPNALVQFNAESPGRLAIGLVTVTPINGDGELVTARFKVNGTKGQVIPLILANAQAWDETSLLDILVNTEPGQITVVSNQMNYFLIAAAAALCCLGLLVIILVIVLWVRRRK